MKKMDNDALTDKTRISVCVHLHIRGFEVNPQYITDVLNIKPSVIRIQGEAYGSRRKAIAKKGYWGLYSTDYLSTYDLDVNKHIDALLSLLPSIRLSQLDGVDDVEFDVLVLSPDDKSDIISGKLTFDLNNKQLSKLINLGTVLSVTVW